MHPVPRPHLFAAAARRAELRTASERAMDRLLDHDGAECPACQQGSCATSQRLLREYNRAREAEGAPAMSHFRAPAK